MYLIPFAVGVGFQRLRGQTLTTSILGSGAVVWTSAQIRKGAFQRVAMMGHRVMSLSAYHITAGIALGVVGGIATSQVLFGDEGRKDAIDFYTGGVSATDYASALAKAPQRIAESIAANRAVAGNAAGLPTGMPIDASGNPRGFNSPSGKNPFDYGPGHEPLY